MAACVALSPNTTASASAPASATPIPTPVLQSGESVANYMTPEKGVDYPNNDISVPGQTGYTTGQIGFYQPSATACASICDAVTSYPCVGFIYYAAGPLANKCYPKTLMTVSATSSIPDGSTIWAYKKINVGQQCCWTPGSNYGTSGPTSSCSSPFAWTLCTTSCWTYKCTGSMGTVYNGQCNSGPASVDASINAAVYTLLGFTGVSCTATAGVTANRSASGAITNVNAPSGSAGSAGSPTAANLVFMTSAAAVSTLAIAASLLA